MRFLICIKQVHEGCDYTIGCGSRFDIIEAESLEDAQEQVIYPEGRDNRSSLEGEYELGEIFIVNVEHVTEINIDVIKEEIINKRNANIQFENERLERAELARLKEKYD